MDDQVLQQHVESYATWVRAFRTSSALEPPPIDAGDPLSALGRELALLADTIARRESELKWLFDVVNAVGQGVLFEEVLGHIYRGFKTVLPFDRIGCALLRDNGQRLVAHWAKTELGSVVRVGVGYGQPMAGSSLEAVLASGQPRIINDLVAYLEAKPASHSTRMIVEEGGRSSLTCPLVVDQVPLGFLFFTSRHANTYSSVHQSMYQQIAAQVSAVLHRSYVYEELLSRNQLLVEQTHALQVVATTDPLTGMLNRLATDAVLERALERLRVDGTPFGIVMCDIDHFKAINDTHGHQVGDLVLKGVADRLKKTMRAGDVVGRIGGEEFLGVVTSCGDTEQLMKTAERLRCAIAETPIAGPPSIAVTASFGVAVADTTESIVDTIAAADAALYEAKRTGRNRVRVRQVAE
ncbi:MAG: sensor domain-containing diguanylate cyclase [Vicinamibacterales bacterium]